MVGYQKRFQQLIVVYLQRHGKTSRDSNHLSLSIDHDVPAYFQFPPYCTKRAASLGTILQESKYSGIVPVTNPKFYSSKTTKIPNDLRYIIHKFD